MFKCRLCSHALIVELDPESFDEASSSAVGESTTAPDDLLLQCGCHFHYQCLLDESPEITLSLACPACNDSIITEPSRSFPIPRVLSQYLNEGGLQENLDILPLITEEAYLSANPAARPARAFMTLCGEGDIPGIIELLIAIQEDPDEGDMSPSDLVRFQDPLDGGKCGLHVAIEKDQMEVVWLLLWLASSLPPQAFPGELRQLAASMNVGREETEGVDIRTLRDGKHQTASELARTMGSAWYGLLHAGVLDT